LKSAGALLEHDSSTLGGNSGSCVVDLETHQVIGLHFRGKYLESNTAVVLSKLINDPLVKKAKLPFV
jgi:V8-like Glu-specific endopeptidase